MDEPADGPRDVSHRLRGAEVIFLPSAAPFAAVGRRASDDLGESLIEGARGDARKIFRHFQHEVGGGVIGDLSLRIPIRAPGVDVAGLGLNGEVLVLRFAILRRQRDRLALRGHGVQPAAVGEVEIENRVCGQRLRQIDHDVVLAADAQGHQVAEFLADDRANHQRLGEAEHQRRDRRALGHQIHARVGVDPLALRIETGVDVVMEDVVIDLIVFAEHRPAHGQLLPGGVDGNRALVRAIEKPDVFGIRRRSHVGEVRLVGLNFRDKIAVLRHHRPRLAAQIAEVEPERLVQVVLKNSVGALQIAVVHQPPGERGRRDVIVELGWVHPHVQPVEPGLELLDPAENFHLSALGEKNICRLDIAMHNSLRVSRLQRIRDLNCQRQQLFQIKRLSAHPLRQRLALQQLHHDKMLPFVLLDRVNRTNIRVVQRGRSSRLSLKPFQQLCVAGHFARQKFYRHPPAQPRILRFIHHTHTAAANFAQYLVLRKCLSYRRIRLCHRPQILVALRGPVKQCMFQI